MVFWLMEETTFEWFFLFGNIRPELFSAFLFRSKIPVNSSIPLWRDRLCSFRVLTVWVITPARSKRARVLEFFGLVNLMYETHCIIRVQF